jgi:hypothetical protein
LYPGQMIQDELTIPIRERKFLLVYISTKSKKIRV